MVKGDLDRLGWMSFPAEPATLHWAAAALVEARRALADPAEPWRCGGTWFVGVDSLPNATDGSISGVPLAGAARAEVDRRFGPQVWHHAQLSVIAPGYPQPSAEESPAAFAFRRDRDAAHVDGLIAEGPDRRRIAEPHAFILGLALNPASSGAAPLALWEGSHTLLRAAFRAALAPHPPGVWGDLDITEPYQAARRRVFQTCPRRLIPLLPGEAVLLDRHLLHGVSPWMQDAHAAPEGRAIAYFRPQYETVADWVSG